MNKLSKFLKNRLKLIYITDPEERYVASQLFSKLPSTDYAVINDILIPYKSKNRMSQIDHVVVSIYGIFCIETKSHRGWIIAIQARHVFTQLFYKRRYLIVPNPVNQNLGHIKALSELLGMRVKKPIMNIVVFPSADKLIVHGYEHVEHVYEAIVDIRQEDKKIYTYKEASEIVEIICAANRKDNESRVEHIEAIRAKFG